MILRNDLRPDNAPDSLEVIQLTNCPHAASHLYMEAQIFTPDSKRFLLHECATAHRGNVNDPHHRYMVCDLEDNCALRPVIAELGATAPSLSPDGKYIYYFVDETKLNGGRFLLKRVNLDGSARQTICVYDIPLPEVDRYANRLYPLSTIRSDGRKIALACFLGNGTEEGKLWGLMVFDLDNSERNLILSGESWCNLHPQYCRSTDPEYMRDILVQENHGNEIEADGTFIKLTNPPGADIHVIKDDGTDFRDMPWGRDGNEACQGHQCWRGTSEWAITGTSTRNPPEKQLIESTAVPHTGHIGSASPGGIRNNISASYPGPCFSHFATDKSGKRLVTDTSATDQGGRLLTAELGEPGKEPASAWKCIAHPRSSWQKDTHLHPFLSPDGTKAFFNSDESGLLQAYMVRGFDLNYT